MPKQQEPIDPTGSTIDEKLEQIREEHHRDMVNIDQRLTTLEEQWADRLDAWGQALFEKMDALIENRTVDLGAAKREEVSLLQDKVRALDARLTTVEKQRGLLDLH